MVKSSPSNPPSIVDFVNADFFVPGSHSKMGGLRREGQVRDTVLRRAVQRDIILQITERIGSAGTGVSAARTEESRHIRNLRLCRSATRRGFVWCWSSNSELFRTLEVMIEERNVTLRLRAISPS
jgi:hypothetical protein